MKKCIRLTDRSMGTGRPAASRSGGMLILVLVIMAVGLILITSALSVTIATRNRFYDDAQTSQARLTLTSTAKTVADAITVTQELRDSLIESWADAGEVVWFQSASGYGFTEGVGSSNTVAPGIGAKSEAAGGWTKAIFGRSGDYITIDFTTGINATGDGVSENVRLYLKLKPPVAAVDGFSAMVKAGTPLSTNEYPRLNVGETFHESGVRYESEYNYILLHGKTLVASSGDSEYYSDAVFTNVITTGSGCHYFSDIIVWGDGAGLYGIGGNGFICETPPGGGTKGSILFLGETPGVAGVFKNADATNKVCTGMGNGMSATAIYFVNTDFRVSSGNPDQIRGDVGNFVDRNTIYQYQMESGVPTFVNNVHSSNGTGTSSTVRYYNGGIKYIDYANKDTDPTLISLRSTAAYYMSPDFKAAVERPLPSTAQAKAMVEYSTSAQITAGADLISNLYADQTFTKEAYYINVSATNKVEGHLTFDLSSNDITLYLIGSGTLTVGKGDGHGLIDFINGGAFWGRIVLLENVNMTLTTNNWSKLPADGGDTGIRATTHSSGPRTFGDPGTTPYLYIIGFGGNTLSAYQMATLDGYIGLYGSNGKLLIENQPIIYGRFEATTLEFTSGDSISLPYCPAPWESPDPEQKPMESKYMVEAYVYS